MTNKKLIYQEFDGWFRLVSEILLSLIRRLAPFMTAVLPGSIFGFTMYEFYLDMTGNAPLSLFVGFSAFAVLESAGIWSGHMIAEYAGEDKFDWRISIPITTLLLYIGIGIGALWLLDSVDQNVQITGTAIFLLAGVVYLLFGLQSYREKKAEKISRIEKNKESDEKEDKNEARDYRRKQNEKKKDFERKMAIKKLELSHEEKMERSTPVLAQKIQKYENAVSGKNGQSYDETKMARLRNYIKANPKALSEMSKKDLSNRLEISRPTLNNYLKIYLEQKE